MSRTLLPFAFVTLAISLVLSACGGGSAEADGEKETSVTLVAYSTPREVYEELVPKFKATAAGNGVEFEQSYGGSGEQSRAVEAGLGADVVALSLAPDVDRLVDAGLVAEDWATGKDDGFVTNSVV